MLLSPTSFNIFLERIMTDALEEHDRKVIIRGRNITNMRFADDIDALAEEEQEVETIVESPDKNCTRYKMEISAEKTKLMTNGANGIQRENKVYRQKLCTVKSFKYLGEVVSDEGLKPEFLSKIGQATAALTKLKPISRDNDIFDQRWGWSGGAMVLGELPVPGRPTVWFPVGQGPTALAVGAGGVVLDIFSLIYHFFSFSLSLGDGPI